MYTFGLLLVATLINIKVGLFILFGFITIFFKKVKLSKSYEVIAFLLVLKLVWMLAIHFSIGTRTGDLYLPQLITQDIILLLMLFIPLSRVNAAQILIPIVFLFALDFSFNMSILFFDVDPLGRLIGHRPDDVLPRAGGIFNHAFTSINITGVAFFIGVFLRSKTIMFFALAALLLNGSMRGPLVGILILLSAFLLYFHFNKGTVFLVLLGFVATVFLVTYISADNAEYISGNYLRIIAWDNAVNHIIQNPILGTHIFKGDEYILIDGGRSGYNIRNAESQFLQVALDFGIIVAMITPLIFFIFMHLNIKKYYSGGRSWEAFSAALMAMVIFTDYFYASFYGSILTQFVFSVIAISYIGSKEIQFSNSSKKL